jgi:hypothetical protein
MQATCVLILRLPGPLAGQLRLTNRCWQSASIPLRRGQPRTSLDTKTRDRRSYVAASWMSVLLPPLRRAWSCGKRRSYREDLAPLGTAQCSTLSSETVPHLFAPTHLLLALSTRLHALMQSALVAAGSPLIMLKLSRPRAPAASSAGRLLRFNSTVASVNMAAAVRLHLLPPVAPQ